MASFGIIVWEFPLQEPFVYTNLLMCSHLSRARDIHMCMCHTHIMFLFYIIPSILRRGGGVWIQGLTHTHITSRAEICVHIHTHLCNLCKRKVSTDIHHTDMFTCASTRVQTRMGNKRTVKYDFQMLIIKKLAIKVFCKLRLLIKDTRTTYHKLIQANWLKTFFLWESCGVLLSSNLLNIKMKY